MKPLRFIRIVAPWAVILLVAIFFYSALSSNWRQLDDISIRFDGLTVAALVCFTGAVIVSGVLWGRLLALLSGQKVKVADAIRIHSASWLLKYIPGQIGSYINKVLWGSRRGISKKTVSTSFIYENVLMVFAGFILATPVFILFQEQLGSNLANLLPLLILIPMLVVLVRPVFYFLLNTLFTKLGRIPFRESDFLSTGQLVKYQLGYLIPRILNGAGFVLIVSSMMTISPDMYIGLGATYILASIIGLLAIFVPGGLGVREAIIVLVLSVYFPVEQAIIVALVARFYATISDLGVGLVYLILNKGKIKQQ
jgi:glycosyltransferase 2 family protein